MNTSAPPLSDTSTPDLDWADLKAFVDEWYASEGREVIQRALNEPSGFVEMLLREPAASYDYYVTPPKSLLP